MSYSNGLSIEQGSVVNPEDKTRCYQCNGITSGGELLIDGRFYCVACVESWRPQTKDTMDMSTETKIKHSHSENIFRTHTRITHATIQRNRAWCSPYYYYIDVNAGSGKCLYPDGTPGETSGLSAVHRLNEMSYSPQLFVYRAYLIEDNPSYCESLRSAVPIQGNDAVEVICGNNHESLPNLVIQPNSYGLLYHDPNKLMPDWDMLDAFVRRPECKMIDILIYMSGSNYKRDRRANGRDYLMDRLPRLKRHWFVQEPYANHQKTFLLGSNWDWDGQAKFRRDLKFAPINTEAGHEFMERINLTEKERFLAHQAGLPIGVMPNISGIPASAPSAPKSLNVAAASVNAARQDE